MFDSVIQPTGIYSAFKSPAVAQNAVNLQKNSATVDSKNTSAMNQNTALPPSDSSSNNLVNKNNSKKSKKTLKQRLPMLTLILLAGSYATIYGLPAARRTLRPFIAKAEENNNVKKILKNQKVKVVIDKLKSNVNRGIDSLEGKVQDTIRNFLKTNFFDYKKS